MRQQSRKLATQFQTAARSPYPFSFGHLHFRCITPMSLGQTRFGLSQFSSSNLAA